jgi:hypothetical protein
VRREDDRHLPRNVRLSSGGHAQVTQLIRTGARYGPRSDRRYRGQGGDELGARGYRAGRRATA